MTKDQVKKVLDRVLNWPRERQEEAVEVLTLMEAQDNSALRLTNEQLTEVRRRRANPSEIRVPLDDVFKRFRTPRE
jgi:methyl coenzyme M reductase gamma subunit